MVYIEKMKALVVFTKQALKAADKAPWHIQEKLALWAKSVANYGLISVQQIPGYHDEPLKGKRTGQRSIRLSRQWRAIYTINEDNTIQLVTVIEVMAHDYRTQ